MPLTAFQAVIAAIEILLLAGGGLALARILGRPEQRARVFGTNRLTHWSISGPEVTLLVVVFFLLGMVGQGMALHFFGAAVKASPDRSGLEVALYGFGFHGVALLAWPLFHLVRRQLHTEYGGEPPPPPVTHRLGLGKLAGHGFVTLALALPVLTLASLIWTSLLRAVGLPDAPQDLIAIFDGTQNPAVLVAMLLVACVLAPLNEELIFRGVIYRFCRQRFGRGLALGVSGVLFGALHQNWAGFVPLALLGVALALAYERTGDLRVPVLAHALFNVNTVLVVLSGLPGT